MTLSMDGQESTPKVMDEGSTMNPVSSCCPGIISPTITPEARKGAVIDYYSSTATSCCCDSQVKLMGYSAGDMAQAPTESSANSRGCGNPVALAQLKPGEVVLDLGCGGGFDVFLAAQRVGSTGYVYGLDMADGMLELAKNNAAKLGATNVQFLKGDIEHIPLEDAVVDVIISNCVINLTPDKVAALREALRVLRPRGRLAISDVVIEPDLEGFPLSEEAIRATLSWEECSSGALTSEQYSEQLTEAGFTDIQMEIRYRYESADLFTKGIPVALTQLPTETFTELVSRFTSTAITAMRPEPSCSPSGA